MSSSIEKPGSGVSETNIYRVAQSSPVHRHHQATAQPEAKSSYTFRDSRHVYKDGIAAVSLDLPVETESAEQIELLGFHQGDTLSLNGLGPVSGTAFIHTLTADTLEVNFCLLVPEMSRRAAAMAFERLSQQSYRLDADGQARLTCCVAKDGKGGYSYSLKDQQSNQGLMSGSLDLRIDNFTTRNIQNQVMNFIVESGNTLTLSIEMAPEKDPKAKLNVSVAPRIGEFDVTRQTEP